MQYFVYFVVQHFVVFCRTLEYFLVQSSILESGNIVLWDLDIERGMFNKLQSIPIGTFFFWFIYVLPFETSGTALCGTTGRL